MSLQYILLVKPLIVNVCPVVMYDIYELSNRIKKYYKYIWFLLNEMLTYDINPCAPCIPIYGKFVKHVNKLFFGNFY